MIEFFLPLHKLTFGRWRSRKRLQLIYLLQLLYLEILLNCEINMYFEIRLDSIKTGWNRNT